MILTHISLTAGVSVKRLTRMFDVKSIHCTIVHCTVYTLAQGSNYTKLQLQAADEQDRLELQALRDRLKPPKPETLSSAPDARQVIM